MPKFVTTPTETALLIEGLEVGAREHYRLAQEAKRLGYPTQAAQFGRKFEQFASLAALAKSTEIVKVTVKHV